MEPQVGTIATISSPRRAAKQGAGAAFVPAAGDDSLPIDQASSPG
jgi:hypothetical protein